MKKIILNIFVILLILMNIFTIILDIYSSDNSSYIIFDKNNIWQVNEEKIKKVSNNKINKLNYSKVKIYTEDVIDGYINNSLYVELYDKDYEKVNISTSYFVVNGNLEVRNYPIITNANLTLNDQQIINTVLKEKSLTYNIEQLFIKKASISSDEIIYSIQPYSEGGPSENSWSLIFSSKNLGYEIIYYKKDNRNESRLSSLDKVIDVNNDNNKELILLSDIPGSAGNECYSLYKYNDKTMKYESIINCEED